MDLNDYRTQLDAIDNQMAELFRQRMSVVKDIADYKKANSAPVLAPNREPARSWRSTPRSSTPPFWS